MLAAASRPTTVSPGAGDARVDAGGGRVADVRGLQILVELLLLLLLLFSLLVALPSLLLPLLLLLFQSLLGPLPVRQKVGLVIKRKNQSS